MNYYFLTHTNMTKVKEILTAVAATVVLSTSPAGAESLHENTQQVTCATKLACDVLSHSIQAQIDELKTKENLTSREKFKLIKLNKKLITAKDSTIAVEKAETSEMKEAQNIKIAELRGVLLSNPDIKKNSQIKAIEKKFDTLD